MYFIDTFTIRRQTNQGVSLSMFKGSRGFGMTLGREVVALSTYFGTYHKMRENNGSLVSGGGGRVGELDTEFSPGYNAYSPDGSEMQFI